MKKKGLLWTAAVLAAAVLLMAVLLGRCSPEETPIGSSRQTTAAAPIFSDSRATGEAEVDFGDFLDGTTAPTEVTTQPMTVPPQTAGATDPTVGTSAETTAPADTTVPTEVTTQPTTVPETQTTEPTTAQTTATEPQATETGSAEPTQSQVAETTQQTGPQQTTASTEPQVGEDGYYDKVIRP